MIKQAIQKAIEGGWANLFQVEYYDGYVFIKEKGGRIYYKEIFLDPLFWQSLGKALGWSNVGMKGRSPMGSNLPAGEWLFRWHLFIDHLAENKNPADFFKELLTK